MTASIFPSIWRGDFRSKAEYDAGVAKLAGAFAVFDRIDDRLLHSRHAMLLPAYCVVCERVVDMHLDWRYGGGSDGSVHPAWTETCTCPGCGLNSRMRALIDFLRKRLVIRPGTRAYIAEQTTPAYRQFKKMFPGLIGSEYLSPEYRSGDIVADWRDLSQVRHEDLTELSFGDGAFDLVITQDVFEHVPNYRKAFAELHRVLMPGGQLVFTIPFFPELEDTRIRAILGSAGVEHLLPPEIHGNPVSNEGALCFQNFGWDIVADLRGAGFADAFGALYWGPWQGHLGLPYFVFAAMRTHR